MGTFADSAALRAVGRTNFPLCKEFIDDAMVVTTDEVCAAIKQKKSGSAEIFEVLSRIYDERLMGSFDQVYLRSHIVAMATFTVDIPRAPAAAAADAHKCGTSASAAPSGAGEACVE